MLNKLKFILVLLFISNALFAEAEYVPGELIVKFKKSSNISAYARVSEINGSDLKVMKVDKGKNVMEAVAELTQNPDVEYAQPNYIYHISSVPNDTYYTTKLWGLKNTAQSILGSGSISTNNPGNLGNDINAEDAWSIISDCGSIVVAIIDTGVKYTHPDISSNMWSGNGYNFINNSSNPLDDNGHGTHVAGIIGAVGDNNTGVTGVCWQIQIMALKAFSACGTGSTTKIISAIDYAINHLSLIHI